MKGCGEAGAIGSPPAVINAITDAIGNNDLSACRRRRRRCGWRSRRPPPRWPPSRRSRRCTRPTITVRRASPRRRRSSPAPPRRATCRRPDAAPDHEAAPRRAVRRDRSPQLAELKGISVTGDTVTIGAATTHAEVQTSRRGQEGDSGARLSRRADRRPGRPPAWGRSAARSPTTTRPPTIRRRCSALGATIKTNKRTIPADDFFTGLFTTALERRRDRHRCRLPDAGQGGYAKFDNPASRYAMTGVFVAKLKDGSVRVGVTGAHARRRLPLGRDREGARALGAASVDPVTVGADGLLADHPRLGRLPRQPRQGHGAARGCSPC